MKVTNIKKIVIWALVFVNVFFLTFFLGRLYTDHSDKKETLVNLSTLFTRNGIDMNIDNIQEGGELAALEISRDIQGEQKLADTLLGQTTMTEQGEIIYTYTGNSGQAIFRNGGEFNITFSSNVYDVTAGAVNTVKSLLQTMNIETVSVEAAGKPGNETVYAICSWSKQPIFNCGIKFVFKEGSLAEISGKYAAKIKVTSNMTDMSSCTTSLLLFLNEVKNGKYSCKQITRVEPGYNLKALGDGLTAVWRIKTDTGVYYIDALTGIIEQDIKQMV